MELMLPCLMASETSFGSPGAVATDHLQRQRKLKRACYSLSVQNNRYEYLRGNIRQVFEGNRRGCVQCVEGRATAEVGLSSLEETRNNRLHKFKVAANQERGKSTFPTDEMAGL